MRSKFTWIFTLFLAFLVHISYAQEKTVTGNVTDPTGLPLPGVNVVVKGTSRGTQTDFDGNYSISVSAGETLTYSYLGMKTTERRVGAGATINLQMDEDAAALEEVVVQGYRTSTKEKSSIASQTITAENIEGRPNASFAQTLQGQVAGLNITTNTGQPGGDSQINLRGISSINGSTEPLFIIDGAPVDEDNFRSLNPNEIESVTVLKDAGATAIYGNRGANGVVIIKTRRGSYNSSLKINYQGIVGYTSLQENDYNLMNSQELLRLERLRNTGRGRGLTDAEIDAFTTTEWLDVFFRTGTSQDHTLTLSSGSDRISQFTSFGYFDQEGILQESSLKRFNIRNNTTAKSENEKFNVSTNLSLNYSESESPNAIGTGGINQNYILGAFQSVPYISPDEYVVGGGANIPVVFANTPLFLLDKLDQFTNEFREIRILGSVDASYKLTNDLTVRNVTSADFTDESFLASESSISFTRSLFAEDGNTTPGAETQRNQKTLLFNSTTSLNWNKEFGKHTVDLGVYTEYFKGHFRQIGFTANGINQKTYSPGDGSSYVGDNPDNDFFVDNAFADILNAGLFSYFGTADYDYDSRYGISGTLRRDASYRFSGSNRWGTFYSVALRWNIHNEAFMEDSFFDVLKLRGSYGVTGNQVIVDLGGQLTNFGLPDGFRDLFATGVGYGGQNSIFLSQVGINTLKWEEVSQANIGLDSEFFDNRVRLGLDFYYKVTDDLFQFAPVTNITGITGLNQNFGSLENKGFDVEFNYSIVRSDDLNISVNAVTNYNKTKMLDIPDPDGINEDQGLAEGRQLFEYYTVRYAGVNPANGNLLFLDADGNITENPNATGDRVASGKNIFPEWQGGFGANIEYKGFYARADFTYTSGVDRFDFDYDGFIDPTNIGQFRLSRDIGRAWTPDNRVTDIPALSATNIALDATSDRFLRDSDYLRLRFTNIGYNVPKRYLENTGFNNLNIFFQGENLYTWTKWRGFDAESTVNTSRRFPTPRIFSFGVQLGF